MTKPFLHWLLGACLLGAWATAAQAWDFEDVAGSARRLSEQVYAPAPRSQYPALDALSYDDYRDIRFRPERAHWRDEGLPFELMFFHVGRAYQQPIVVHEVVRGQARRLKLPAADFDYGRNAALMRDAADAEVAGFRVHYPMNRPDYKDEVLVFLGASYFRALGGGQQYGLSARGLAIDTAGAPPEAAEEFPRFDSFWIEKPEPGAKVLVVYARLNSPRLTGAYRFEIRPGASTQVAVRARLFVRGNAAPLHTLGMAPLTSMFLSGENQPGNGDFRPEVHDSDGLQVHSSTGEWLWRPLINPAERLTTSLMVPGLKGFGLFQRDRQFSHYEDLEAHYERRPSVWVQPQGDWGPGRVELMQYHAANETYDNTVAYWVPAIGPQPGRGTDFSYTLHWFKDNAPATPRGWVVQTREGRGGTEPVAAGEVAMQIDFAGPAFDGLTAQAPVRPVVDTGDTGRVREARVQYNAPAKAWRLTLRLQRTAANRVLDVRAHLVHGNDVLTETWTAAFPPPSPDRASLVAAQPE